MADLTTEDDALEADEENGSGDGASDDFEKWEGELSGGNEGDSLSLREEPSVSEDEGIAEDPDELEHKRDNSERAKISLPETIIFTLLALFTDGVEFLTASANVLPVIGQAIWFIGWVFGICVSLIILIWTVLRGVHGRQMIKILVIRIIGFLADAGILIGWLPIRTVILLVTIWLNNHLENKEIDRLVGLLSKVKV